jgi:hypothetical protein
MSPCADSLAVVGRHMAVGHGEVAVPPFDWIAFENEVPTPSWTKVPGTQSCTKTGLQGRSDKAAPDVNSALVKQQVVVLGSSRWLVAQNYHSLRKASKIGKCSTPIHVVGHGNAPRKSSMVRDFFTN